MDTETLALMQRLCTEARARIHATITALLATLTSRDQPDE